MTTYLLDVNLLLALTDPMHIHHEAAHRWFEDKGHQSWATCPITENGFVRIASHPNYPNRPGDVSAVLAILSRTHPFQFILKDPYAIIQFAGPERLGFRQFLLGQ